MAMTEMLFPGFLHKAFTVSYDDGVQQDRWLIDVLKKNGIKGTFNINSENLEREEVTYPKDAYHRPMARREAVGVYANSGMEVAVHGYTHPFMDKLSTECAAYEVIKCREKLEEVFGGVVRGMAYPMGTTDDKTVAALAACGIAYSRTIASTHNFHISEDWLRWAPTCHHSEPVVDELADEFIGEFHDWYPWLFYIWGHAYEFELDNSWERIEKLYEKLGNRPDVWYATNIEIYDYVTAYRSLRYNVTGTTVFNPTATTVYFSVGGKNLTVNPGETISFK